MTLAEIIQKVYDETPLQQTDGGFKRVHLQTSDGLDFTGARLETVGAMLQRETGWTPEKVKARCFGTEDEWILTLSDEEDVCLSQEEI